MQMVYEHGVINEVRELLRMPLSRSARQVHGLADIETYLTGKQNLKEMTGIWQQRVRNYAKRQYSWFRATSNVQWIMIPAEEHPWETAQRLLDAIRRGAPAEPRQPEQLEVSF
jgi:tRNA A37 N6-isopentenylltransferase MiaA